MSVLEEVLNAVNEYKKNANDDPRFIITTAPRAREMLSDIIGIQGEGCPPAIVEAVYIEDDDEFADAMTKLGLYGVRIMVVTTQIVVGGWADNGCA